MLQLMMPTTKRGADEAPTPTDYSDCPAIARDNSQGARMPRRMTEQERQEFLAEPRVGVLSVASDDDRPPLTVPLWYGYEPGGNISFFTGTQGRKACKTRLIEKAGVLSLSVQREEFPYRYVTVEGTVVGIDRPPSVEQMLAVARRYLPEEAARGFVDAELGRPSSELVLFTVRPDRWLTADFSEEDNR
jgi:nitroimidazol reductase NimA-like FMN-containing flavoprotein (pyridoxamine 5'-phosphate oxidase superfamily)